MEMFSLENVDELFLINRSAFSVTINSQQVTVVGYAYEDICKVVSLLYFGVHHP